MPPTIIFGRETVKSLTPHVHAAFRVGDVPRIKHLCALLLLADQRPAPVVAERLGGGRSTVSAWLNAFLVDRFARLQRRKPAGRPAKLTPAEKRRLEILVEGVLKLQAMPVAVGTVPCSTR